MHNGALRKMALALTLWLALHMSSLKAQIFTNDLPLQAVTTGSNPVDFEFRSDGTLIAKGNFGVGSLGSGDEGAGTRMLWFPSLGAFRAGGVDGTQWDQDNIGQYSAAFGYKTTASAYYSMAWGRQTGAFGMCSTASGAYSWAGNFLDLVMGGWSSANGGHSTAIGTWSTASGYGSVALGGGDTASGSSSTVIGNGNTASGYYATASGRYTTASAYNSFVTGTYNVGGGSSTAWVSTDPLFEIGNGTSSTPSDALVVYKNGNGILQGTLQIAPGGDIPMYTGD